MEGAATTARVVTTRTSESSTGEGSFRYRPGLDGVRAIAVLGVMCYHAGVKRAPGGFLGVDVFFVLSGYLITSLLLEEHRRSGRIDVPGFWLRRARRLLPALFIMLIGVAFYAAFVLLPPERGPVRGDALATLLYVANWHFIFTHSSYFQQFAAPSPLRHAWSLAIEEQWYLLWPLVAGFVLARRGKHWLLILSVALATASAVEAVALYQPHQDPSRVYYGTDTRAQALLVGSILAIALTSPRLRRAGDRLGQPLAWCGFAALLAMGITVHDTSPFVFEGGLTIAAIAAGAFVLGAGATRRTPLVAGLSVAPLRWIGLISYGLYLYHWPLDVWLTSSRTHVSGSELLALRFAATFAVATLSYYLVERPIRQRRLERSGSRRAFSFSLAGIAAIVATLLVASTAGAMSWEQYVTRSAGSGSVSGAAGPNAPRILVAGDSVAFTLGWYTDPKWFHFAKWSGAQIIGCGVMRSGFDVDGTETRVDKPCEGAIAHWQAMVQANDPDLVVMVAGAWEVFDHIVDGKLVSPGTPAFQHALLHDAQDATRVLTSRGANIVFLDVPCYGAFGNPGDKERQDPKRRAAVNAVFAQLAAQNPKVSVLHWSSFLCPGGKYVDRIDGVRLRGDGLHFTPRGGPIVWSWLAPRLLADARVAKAARASGRASAPSGANLNVRWEVVGTRWEFRLTLQNNATRGRCNGRRTFGQEGIPMTMAISAATSTPVQWPQTTAPAAPPDFSKNMQSVADLFGLSTDDLKTQLASGKSLADIAQSKGVSRDTLVSTLEKAMQTNAPANASGFASDLDAIANRIVDHKGVGGAHHRHGSRAATDVSGIDFQSNTDQLFSSVANQLNLSPTDLVSQLESGLSLTDISAQAGTDPSQLFDAIGTGSAVNLLS